GASGIGTDARSSLAVRLGGGAAAGADNGSTGRGDDPARGPSRGRVPNPGPPPRHVLGFLPPQWQAPGRGGRPPRRPEEKKTGEIIVRYPPDQIHHYDIPAVRSDETTVALVPSILIGAPAAPAIAAQRETGTAPFTLDETVFEASRHHDLVRVFVPFGLD